MKAVQKGFTLIELMIVIAIIGILAAIAIPAYQNYTVRSQVTEGLSMADGWKTSISEYFAQNGSFPVAYTSSGGAGNIVAAATAGKYVGSITFGGAGQIKITYSGSQVNSKINGSVMMLSPGTDSNLDVIWICGTASLPTNVSSTVADNTTVSAQYLPASCHA